MAPGRQCKFHAPLAALVLHVKCKGHIQDEAPLF